MTKKIVYRPVDACPVPVMVRVFNTDFKMYPEVPLEVAEYIADALLHPQTGNSRIFAVPSQEVSETPMPHGEFLQSQPDVMVADESAAQHNASFFRNNIDSDAVVNAPVEDENSNEVDVNDE